MLSQFLHVQRLRLEERREVVGVGPQLLCALHTNYQIKWLQLHQSVTEVQLQL